MELTRRVGGRSGEFRCVWKEDFEECMLVTTEPGDMTKKSRRIKPALYACSSDILDQQVLLPHSNGYEDEFRESIDMVPEGRWH